MASIWKRLFYRQMAPPAAAPPPSPTTPVEVQLEALRAQLMQLQLEWAETLDKLQAWANRQATRDRRALSRRLDGPQDDEPAPAGTPPAPPDRASAKAALRSRLGHLNGR